MSCARTVNGRVFISLERGYPLSSELELLAHPDCCGVVLFAENYRDIEQIADLCQAIRASRHDDLLIGIDQEGGRIQRLGDPFARLPAQRQFGRYYARGKQSRALQTAARLGWLRAAELRAVGIDFTFAPVLDLDYRHSAIIGDRAYSGQASAVASLGLAMIEGARKAGAISVAKHFPGHGYVEADSHTDACIDKRGYAAIESTDLHPFAMAAEAHIDAMMSAHIKYPACDGEIVTYSRFWATEVLRGRMRFKGLLMSDDLSMEGARRAGEGESATPAAIAERALAALAAGHDIVLVCKSYEAAEATLKAVARQRGRQAPFHQLIGGPAVNPLSWQQLVDSEEYRQACESLQAMTGELAR